MSKSKSESKAKTEPDHITITFDLFDLPTAQHKAGLAGLLLLIEAMKKYRRPPERIPVVEEVWKTTARITFAPESIQGVMDELYDAESVETASASKWPGTDPKREDSIEQLDPKTGKAKQVKRFIYDTVRPRGSFLSCFLNTPEDNPWLKLWRIMIWTIPRGINTTRVPFQQRASGQPCAEGQASWSALCADRAKRERSQFATSPISGALMLAAQSVNAEGVAFQGRNDHNLLLHFWQVVAMTYVPQIVDNDGKTKAVGFVLAIPDVADLVEFGHAFPTLIGSLSNTARGYHPADALIDVPVQSNLEFLRTLRNLASEKAEAEGWGQCVSAVESYHMLKAGNNIKLMAFDRVPNRTDLISKYERIRKTFRSPLFRASRLRSLLRGLPWYGGLLELYSERPWPFFIEGTETPKYLPRFGKDARLQFRGITEDTFDMKPEEMDDEQRLSRIIQRLVNRYIEGRAASKAGRKIDDFPVETIDGKKRRDFPPDVREAQRKVCSDAFLAMRSRHDQDFVEYFVGSICSVPQVLSNLDYQFLTTILLRRTQRNAIGPVQPSWEDVKALAMTAVSAYASRVQPRETSASTPEGSQSA